MRAAFLATRPGGVKRNRPQPDISMADGLVTEGFAAALPRRRDRLLDALGGP